MTAVANSAANTAGCNAVVTSLLVCCGFVVCWTPNVIIYLLSLFGYNVDFGSWLYHFTLVLVFTNSCINPFIYAAKYREFQQGVRRLISQLTKNQQQQSMIA